MNRLYFTLTNKNCKLNKNNGMWSIELPRDFMDSRRPAKAISVLNFKYYSTHNCNQHLNTLMAIDETSFHSPTLCDGNFNQDYYITNANYVYNTVYKTYKIRSNPQYFEFFFKNSKDEIIKQFDYTADEVGGTCPIIEKFRIELELIY